MHATLDLALEDNNPETGFNLLESCSEFDPCLKVILISGNDTPENARRAVASGAFDFFGKPIDVAELRILLRRALHLGSLERENGAMDDGPNDRRLGSLVGRSPEMHEVFRTIRRVARTDLSVLLLGESGTGKELVAKALHANSPRRDKPFVAIDCTALVENLLESELFGHVKGAFTDAAADKAGLFEQADGGTLFLDEIGELPLPLQVKLLRVIQDEEIKRVGGTTAKKVNVRVVSATARNLEAEVAAGRFREDLFFRLNVFSIVLPPLRERVEDIPLLVDHFVGRFAREFVKKTNGCSPDALQALLTYQWPGNVRELENVIERGVILCDKEVLAQEHLTARITGSAPGVGGVLVSGDILSIKQAEVTLEKELIRRALAKTCGNRTHAARLLEISHRALLYKLKEYGVA